MRVGCGGKPPQPHVEKFYQKGGFKMKGKYEQPTVRIVGIAQRDLISTSVESTKEFNRDWLDSVGDMPGETE